MRLKQRPHLRDSRRVGAIALADQQSSGIEPDHVSGFSFSRRLDSTELGNAQAPAELNVALRLRNAVRLAGMQADQSLIGRQRGIVSVHRIERKIRGRGKMEDFRPGGFELAAKFVMLRLRGREVRRVQETQLPPAVCCAGLVPSCGSRRAHQYSLQTPDHRMTVERLAVER